ncbi:MAG: hypothetical protein ABJJ53_07275 [Sulfitobacter sp.]
MSVGLVVCLLGVFVPDNAILGIGCLVAVIGGYGIAQSIFGLLIDATIGAGWIGVVLFVILFGFFAMRVYGALASKT